MTQLRIDNSRKTLNLELLLDGEKESIVVHVAQYALADNGEFRFSGISVSRAWMNLLTQEMLVGKSLPVPQDKVKWLRMVL